MASPNHNISSDYTSPVNNEILVITRPTLTQNPPLFFPYNRYYYFSPPPIYFNLLPPSPSIFVYYPLWYTNPNPNVRFESMQERPSIHPPNLSQELSPSIHSPNPSQELSSTTTNGSYEASLQDFGQRDNKVTWRRKIKREDKSNDDHITTVMLRNIPNKYTREMMIDFLDKHCEEENKEKDEEFPISAYDFIYLPIDFRSGMNKGYAFVNFTNAEAVRKFKVACNYKPWLHFESRKMLEIAYARIQGKDDLMKHFEQMTYPVEAYSAVCFSPARSGPNNTVRTIIVGKCTEPTTSV